jgi:type II secretory pathway component PulF
VRRAADLAERGVALGDAMDQAAVDRRAAWFARSLADRADLSEGLMRLGDDYAANFSWLASIAARTAPPLAIIAIGVLVACVVIGLYLPILKVMNSLGG